MLLKGSKGNDVARLQGDLASFGFQIAVDGDFGPQTEEAVRSFQKQNGLTVDGIVGSETEAAISKAIKARPEIALTNKLKIMLDVQHIGKSTDPDDRGVESNGLIECFEVEKYFNAAVQLLEAEGHRIFWGGIKGITGDYPARAEWVNENGMDLYLAGHLNSFDGKASYSLVEVAYNGSKSSLKLARLLAREFSKELKTKGIIKKLKRGERGNVCVEHTSMPAVILEPLFMDNPLHADLLKRDGHERIASAIASGIAKWTGS